MGRLNLNKFSRQDGFTLVELLMVMLVIGVVVGMGFYGFQNFNNSTVVTNAAAELVSDLRSVQNQTYVGLNSLNNTMVLLISGSNVYTINTNGALFNGSTILNTITHTGVVMNIENYPTKWVYICFPNKSLTTYTGISGTSYCGPCMGTGLNNSTDGNYFACVATDDTHGVATIGNGINTLTIDVTNPGGTYTKKVVITGSGVSVNSINIQ